MPDIYTVDAARNLLRQAAIVEPDQRRLEMIGEAASEITNWDSLAAQAETHNMAPILHRHLGQVDADVAAGGRRLLGALAIRHRHANATLTAACQEMLQNFQSAGIDSIVLKGMALSHIVYPEFTLRPMRDIDVLVPASEALRAQSVLAETGFSISDNHDFAFDGGRYMRNHHHLPEARIQRDGMTVTVEIHTDALSGDYPESLSYERVADNAREFSLDGVAAMAMGHGDMLTHLCRHAFEPGHEIRIGSVNDIISYATKFADEIDWAQFQTERAFAANGISLLHFVSPLPAPLADLVPDTPSPSHPGFGMRPLGAILNNEAKLSEKVRELIFPPSWWMHAYYGQAPAQSENVIRWSKHAPRVGRWLSRRAKAAAGI